MSSRMHLYMFMFRDGVCPLHLHRRLRNAHWSSRCELRSMRLGVAAYACASGLRPTRVHAARCVTLLDARLTCNKCWTGW